MKQIIYSPLKDITLYELAHVLKVFTYATLPVDMKTDDTLFALYEALPPEAKRHFRIVEKK